MLNTNGLNIGITRGDAAGLAFHFEGDDIPQDGATVLFQVRPYVLGDYTVLEKTLIVDDGGCELSFLPEDTERMKPGEYYWNIRVLYSNGTEPWTVLPQWAIFTVLP